MFRKHWWTSFTVTHSNSLSFLQLQIYLKQESWPLCWHAPVIRLLHSLQAFTSHLQLNLKLSNAATWNGTTQRSITTPGRLCLIRPCPLLHSLQWKGSSCLRCQRLQAKETRAGKLEQQLGAGFWDSRASLQALGPFLSIYGFDMKIMSAGKNNIQPSEAPVVNCSTSDCPVAPFWATIAAIAIMAWSWYFQ